MPWMAVEGRLRKMLNKTKSEKTKRLRESTSIARKTLLMWGPEKKEVAMRTQIGASGRLRISNGSERVTPRP